MASWKQNSVSFLQDWCAAPSHIVSPQVMYFMFLLIFGIFPQCTKTTSSGLSLKLWFIFFSLHIFNTLANIWPSCDSVYKSFTVRMPNKPCNHDYLPEDSFENWRVSIFLLQAVPHSTTNRCESHFKGNSNISCEVSQSQGLFLQVCWHLYQPNFTKSPGQLFPCFPHCLHWILTTLTIENKPVTRFGKAMNIAKGEATRVSSKMYWIIKHES